MHLGVVKSLKPLPRHDRVGLVPDPRRGGAVTAIRVLVADDHPSFVRALTMLLEVAQGADNRTIARGLHLSEKTVRNYLSTILTKIGATTRAEAIVMAHKAGLGSSADA